MKYLSSVSLLLNGIWWLTVLQFGKAEYLSQIRKDLLCMVSNAKCNYSQVGPLEIISITLTVRCLQCF